MKKIAVIALLLPLLSACATTEADGGRVMNGLAGTAWRLAALQSSDDSIGTVRPDDPSKYELRLGADGTATFRLDCNRGSGRWESAQPGQISFPPFGLTRAMCPAGSLDTRVAREVGYVRTYVLEGDRLILNMMADGGVQVWTRIDE